jgi:uncharacterized protein YbaR (Trm112 family)
MSKLPQELLEKLACPKCRGPVEPTPGGDGLSCATCDLLYEIHDGIPVMLEGLAKPLSGRDK